MSHTKAIVTLAISGLERRWRRVCAPSWTAYAQRHGYDVICIDEPLDRSERARGRSPAWQKLLVLDQAFAKRYERIVWIDADVVINPAAPSIVKGVPIEHVGAVDEFACPTPERFGSVLSKLYRYWELTGSGFIRNETAREFYSAYGLPPRFDSVVQAGVLVLSPAHHREVLADVYERYDYSDRPSAWNGEMRPLSYELLQAGCVTWIDPRFNYVWGQYKALHFPFLLNHPGHPRAVEAAHAALADVHFLHFAGEHDELELLRKRLTPRPQRAPSITRPPIAALRAPVVLLCPDGPDRARRALASVREARAEHLLVVARESGSEQSIAELVDWDCRLELHSASAEEAHWLEASLDWAFGLVTEAIVLADDCVPDPTFFGFCEELLARYRDDPRVMAICGSELSSPLDLGSYAYKFSRYPLTWGWATWRRAWRLHDPEMVEWPALRESGWLDRLLTERQAVTYWTGRFDRAASQRGSWTDAWTFTCWKHGGLGATTEVNLVANVGFGWDASPSPESMFADMPVGTARRPPRHPPEVIRDDAYDSFLEDVLFSGNAKRLLERIRSRHRSRRAERPVAQQRR